MPKHIDRGERRTSALAIVAGMILVVVSAIVVGRFTFHQLLAINWYPYRPFNWVLDDLGSSDPDKRSKAWEELERRKSGLSAAKSARLVDQMLKDIDAATAILPSGDPSPVIMSESKDLFDRAHSHMLTPLQHAAWIDFIVRRSDVGNPIALAELNRLIEADELTSKQHNDLIELGLSHKPISTFDELMDVVGEEWQHGRLTADQESRYFRASIQLFPDFFRVPNSVNFGEPVPYTMEFIERPTDPEKTWTERMSMDHVKVDSQELANTDSSPGRNQNQSWRHELPPQSPGVHTLRVRYGVKITSSRSSPGHPPREYEFREEVSGTFTVLETTAPPRPLVDPPTPR
jgi:hypothetical protein